MTDRWCLEAMEKRPIPARDPLGYSLTAEFVESFAPLGVRLRLETNSREILEACRVSFGCYGLPDAGAPTAQFVIRLFVDNSFEAVPPWPNPVFRSQGHLFYVSVGGQNTCVADLRRRYAAGFVSPAMAQDHDFLRSTFLECLALTMMTFGRGATHTYVHASAVAKGGRGLIFSGLRESGKSTLAYACARRGFYFVTDDVVYLNEGNDGLVAWGRPGRLRFLLDGVRFFPELKLKVDTLQTQNHDFVEFDVEDILPGQAEVCCRPAALFFLERTSGPTSYEKLEPGEAVRLLTRDLIHDSPAVMKKHLHMWTALASRGSYRLFCSEDLHAVVELLESFLEARCAESQALW
jgi:hypothetical protein